MSLSISISLSNPSWLLCPYFPSLFLKDILHFWTKSLFSILICFIFTIFQPSNSSFRWQQLLLFFFHNFLLFVTHLSSFILIFSFIFYPFFHHLLISFLWIILFLLFVTYSDFYVNISSFESFTISLFNDNYTLPSFASFWSIT